MSTRVYCTSDDLIEFEGDFKGEADYSGDDECGSLIVLSDGTLLDVKYGKGDLPIWEVRLVKQGLLFEHIDQCIDEDAEVYSDVATFGDGIKWAFVAEEWKSVK